MVQSARSKSSFNKGPRETFGRCHAPRLVDQFGELDLAAAGPRTVLSCDDKCVFMEKDFRLGVFRRNRIRQPPDHQVYVVLAQFTVLQVGEIADRGAKGESRILS